MTSVDLRWRCSRPGGGAGCRGVRIATNAVRPTGGSWIAALDLDDSAPVRLEAATGCEAWRRRCGHGTALILAWRVDLHRPDPVAGRPDTLPSSASVIPLTSATRHDPRPRSRHGPHTLTRQSLLELRPAATTPALLSSASAAHAGHRARIGHDGSGTAMARKFLTSGWVGRSQWRHGRRCRLPRRQLADTLASVRPERGRRFDPRQRQPPGDGIGARPGRGHFLRRRGAVPQRHPILGHPRPDLASYSGAELWSADGSITRRAAAFLQARLRRGTPPAHREPTPRLLRGRHRAFRWMRDAPLWDVTDAGHLTGTARRLAIAVDWIRRRLHRREPNHRTRHAHGITGGTPSRATRSRPHERRAVITTSSRRAPSSDLDPSTSTGRDHYHAEHDGALPLPAVPLTLVVR